MSRYIRKTWNSFSNDFFFLPPLINIPLHLSLSPPHRKVEFVLPCEPCDDS